MGASPTCERQAPEGRSVVPNAPDFGKPAPARPISSRSLEEAINQTSLHDGYRSLGLLLRVIAKHMRQHLGVEDAARRRDKGTEILLPIERVAETDALGGEVRSSNTRALISSDLHALPVFVRGPGAVKLAAGAGRGREEDL